MNFHDLAANEMLELLESLVGWSGNCFVSFFLLSLSLTHTHRTNIYDGSELLIILSSFRLVNNTKCIRCGRHVVDCLPLCPTDGVLQLTYVTGVLTFCKNHKDNP